MVLCLVAGSACRKQGNELAELTHSPTAVARETRLEKALGDHNAALAGKPLAKWILPAPLREISGLALTNDGRMLAEQDETGEIWEIDYRRGILVKHFFIGDGGEGRLRGHHGRERRGVSAGEQRPDLQFHEGANNAHVAYSVIETGLKKECEFESMVFDPTINSLRAGVQAHPRQGRARRDRPLSVEPGERYDDRAAVEGHGAARSTFSARTTGSIFIRRTSRSIPRRATTSSLPRSKRR